MNDIRKKRELIERSLEELRQRQKDRERGERAPLEYQLNLLRNQCKLLGHPNGKEDLSKSLPEFYCPDCGVTYNL